MVTPGTGRAAVWLLWLLPWVGLVAGHAQELYPKPLIHTPANHPADHLLLVDVEGMHAFDLARWVAAHPGSTLAMLTRRGDTFTDAHTPVADPYAGLLALVTGGGPISTGITGSLGWDRSLLPSAGCAVTALPGGAPIDPGMLLAKPGTSATLAGSAVAWDPANGCRPLRAGALLRVNTLFELVHTKLGPTAWVGFRPGEAELMRGPSGKGLDASCLIEDPSASVAAARAGDVRRMAVLRAWMSAASEGTAAPPCGGMPAKTPVMAGIALRAVAAAQTGAGSGYEHSDGTPNEQLEGSLASVDAHLGTLVAALKAQNLFDSTWIVVTSSYGSGEVGRAVRVLPLAPLTEAVSGRAQVSRGPTTRVLFAAGGATARLWLDDPACVPAAVESLESARDRLGILSVAAGAQLDLQANPRSADPRSPDIVVTARPGSVFELAPGMKEAAAYGGQDDTSTHVPMLVSGRQLGITPEGRLDKTPVPTTQLAPLLMRALGMEKFDLDALHHEHTPALPGIF